MIRQPRDRPLTLKGKRKGPFVSRCISHVPHGLHDRLPYVRSCQRLAVSMRKSVGQSEPVACPPEPLAAALPSRPGFVRSVGMAALLPVATVWRWLQRWPFHCCHWQQFDAAFLPPGTCCQWQQSCASSSRSLGCCQWQHLASRHPGCVGVATGNSSKPLFRCRVSVASGNSLGPPPAAGWGVASGNTSRRAFPVVSVLPLATVRRRFSAAGYLLPVATGGDVCASRCGCCHWQQLGGRYSS